MSHRASIGFNRRLCRIVFEVGQLFSRSRFTRSITSILCGRRLPPLNALDTVTSSLVRPSKVAFASPLSIHSGDRFSLQLQDATVISNGRVSWKRMNEPRPNSNEAKPSAAERTVMASTLPFPRTWWIDPGKILGGCFPGSARRGRDTSNAGPVSVRRRQDDHQLTGAG